MTASATWDLTYDTAQFLVLPTAAALAADPQAGTAWAVAAIGHIGGDRELTVGDRTALAQTAGAILGLVEPDVTRFWYAPPGIYSDVVVSLFVTEQGADTPQRLEEMLAGYTDATAAEITAVQTDTHGNGFFVRRTAAVPTEGQNTLMADWTLMLGTDSWLIVLNAMGSTLPVFTLLEEELLPLATGVVLPA